eukprot:CAMPEP_0174736918 /NCGR_PEP_ID=MMETSP1094-20130205/67512_1 /TAXON_ID=156173 /ORGANISM="Chrysochromulina brevifilum, Strain UTEX LB 985" /LENGTH=58 /DNA_ID=CAMNT_0015940093 /DNA_START=325 /DNA_END=497 /DNA_ORIENTATION=-
MVMVIVIVMVMAWPHARDAHVPGHAAHPSRQSYCYGCAQPINQSTVCHAGMAMLPILP